MSSSSSSSSMEELPHDLLLEFLSRISTKYLIRCSGVSKSWRDIMTEEYFRNLHSYRCITLSSHIASPPSPLFFTVCESADFTVISMSLAQEYHAHGGSSKYKPRARQIIRRRSSSYQDFNETWETTEYKLSNTCNGLVCIKPSRDYKQYIEVFNPLTLEYTTVPPCSNVDLLSCSVGLGYSPSTKEYKVVALTTTHEFRFYSLAEGDDAATGGKLLVYSLGSSDKQWRYVQDINFYPLKGPVYLQGRLYWIIYDGRSLERTKLCTKSFDLKIEKLSAIENVPGLSEDQEVHLVEFNGAVATIFIKISHIEIWALMNNCWEIKHSIRLPRIPVGIEESFPRYIGLWERDHGNLQIWLRDVMLLYDGRDNSEGSCMMYKEPDLSQKKFAWHLCTSYKPTFVSLKRLGCETREASLDRIWEMELPPDCHLKWRVIDLEF